MSSGSAGRAVSGATWLVGRFESLSIGDLRRRIEGGAGESRLFVFAGVSPATDIGALQATAGGRPLFQVASQFNCLESPASTVVSVAGYFSDPTQGPAWRSRRFRQRFCGTTPHLLGMALALFRR